MEFFKSLSLLHKRIIAGLLGAGAGYAYYFYIGCVSGSCPITSNPYISTIYGMALGILLVPTPQKKSDNEHGNNASAGQEI